MPGPSTGPTNPALPLADGVSHYQRLQVAPAASRDELRQAFRSLSKRYHPDTTELPAAEAERAFQLLRQAYAVLSDPAARARYDLELQARVALPSPARMTAPAAPADVRRALSGGEWLALLLLGVALVLSLLLGVGLAWARGAELVHWPSWWSEGPLVEEPAPAAVDDGLPDVPPLPDPVA